MMMQSDIFEIQAEICKVLANPKRIRILTLLKDKEQSVTEIANSLGISQSNTSQHLMNMRSKGVLKARRVGRKNLYSIALPELTLACEHVERAIDRLIGGRRTT